MKTKLAALVALLLGAFFANAQTPEVEATITERVTALIAAGDYSSEEATAIYDELKSTSAELEGPLRMFVFRVGKTSLGIVPTAPGYPPASVLQDFAYDPVARILLAGNDGTLAALTDADITAAVETACGQAILSGTPEFKARIVGLVNGTGCAEHPWVNLFRSYRSTLTRPEQIALTKTEQAGLLALPRRVPMQDAFSLALSIDLAAYRTLNPELF